MTNDEFIKTLRVNRYGHKVSKGGVTVTHQGYVYMHSLTTLPEGVKFENQGGVYMHSLTTLPEGVKFENQGYVDLHSLTTLPEGVKFENQGYVDLRSLTGKHIYRGTECEFRHVDGCTMVITHTKAYGGYTVHSARYFAGGEVPDMKKCYVAESDGLYAHGSTMKEAIEDLQFKLDDVADKAEVAEAIRESGNVTISQFRALTGACKEGVRHHLEGHGIDLDSIESLPLSDAIKAMSGTSYGDKFKEHVEKNGLLHDRAYAYRAADQAKVIVAEAKGGKAND